MDFIYDSSGRPYAMVSGESTVSAVYYYVLNQQGDVIRVTGAGGTTVAEYTYNAWGKLMDCSGWLATTNPIRYRGYYYDNETGFYYLQSRYYDPTIGRFINADQFASTGQDFLGYNMFIYCNNNPVMHNDPTGEFGVATLCVIGGLAGGLINYASEVITNYREGCRGADAWVNNVNWGGVAASAFSGALSAIPGAGVAVKSADIVGGALLEHGINAGLHALNKNLGNKWDTHAFVADVITNTVDSAIDLGIDTPRYIRDIKDEARNIGIKGTKRLTTYLNVKQISSILVNSFTSEFIPTYSKQKASISIKPFRIRV